MHTETNGLEPLDSETAVKLFLDEKAMNCTDATVRNHRSRMNHFLEWCDEEQIDNLNEVSGRDIQRYRLWLGAKDDLSPITIKNQLSGFKVSLKWSASVEAVPENLYTKVMVPRGRPSERSNEQILEADRAEELLDYLPRYEYASTEPVLLAFLWDRVDVSVPVLDKHSDQRSEERKSERRLEELERRLPSFSTE